MPVDIPSGAVMLVLVVGALVVAGAITGIVAALRRGAGEAAAHGLVLDADPLTARVTAEVHAGEEQVLIHLARSLALPTARDGVDYGAIYLSASVDATIRLASRSEIGRGFDGEIRVRRTRRSTVVEYVVLRVPGDEVVQRRILQLDDRVTDAIRSLDPSADIRRIGDRQLPVPGLTPTVR